jgi:predicted ester cyclase
MQPSSAQTTGLVQAFYDRIWNAGDMNAAAEILAADFAFRGSLGPEMRGREAFCEYVRSVRTPLEGYRCDILDCVTEGEKAFAKMRFSGVHVGPFRGYTPTGKSVQWLGG